MVLWVGLQYLMVVFPDHTHSFFSYSSIILIKTQQKNDIEVFRGRWAYHTIPRTKNISHEEYRRA